MTYETISAEREGFEPPEVLPSTVFKTAAIDRSAISPNRAAKITFFRKRTDRRFSRCGDARPRLSTYRKINISW